jgi:hypothetical protein
MSYNIPNLRSAEKYGFIFQDALGFIPSGYFEREKLGKEILLSRDANSGTNMSKNTIPCELFYINIDIIDVMMEKTSILTLFPERRLQNPDLSPHNIKDNLDFPMLPSLNVAKFEYVIDYYFEDLDVSTLSKIIMAATLQMEAAQSLKKRILKTYLLGDKTLYGLLNAPSLLPAITPGNISSTLVPIFSWKKKSYPQILDDLDHLKNHLKSQAKSLITPATPLTLGIFPKAYSDLDIRLQEDESLPDKIKSTFSDLEIIIFPAMCEMSKDKIVLFAKELDGIPTALFQYLDKLRINPPVRERTGFKQVFSSSIFGCVINNPLVFAIMEGM